MSMNGFFLTEFKINLNALFLGELRGSQVDYEITENRWLLQIKLGNSTPAFTFHSVFRTGAGGPWNQLCG